MNDTGGASVDLCPVATAVADDAVRLIVKPGTEWSTVYGRCQDLAPEAFHDDRLLSFWGGRWRLEGLPTTAISPVDGSVLTGPPRLELVDATRAVRAGLNEHRTWSLAPLAERKARVSAALDDLAEHRELLALLLIWETGKTWRSATIEVDLCIDGVRWHVDEIDAMLAGRDPLSGPVSNIASGNRPMSVLLHAMFVQALAGNAVVAKAPADGGVHCLTLATALAARHGVPFTLVGGNGSELSAALVQSSMVGCVSFLGGRGTGGEAAARLVDSGRRHILEQEGLNCWGVWEFGDWSGLAGHLRASFEHGRHRGTAYPRYVIQRSLADDFFAAYLPVVRSLTFGHPLAVEEPEDPLPRLDFGPLISEAKATELREGIDDAVSRGGVPVYRGELANGRFLPGQDTSAYLAPAAILDGSPPLDAEPFGPVDTFVLVDTEAELLAAMNAGDGSFAASIACDDEATAQRLAGSVEAFKVSINRPRSHGEGAEHFSASWNGAFAGGELLVRAVTVGPPGENHDIPSGVPYPPA
jgi:acyl-CoA reductase-like NAD-dependent aldehyde dehydrogenase